MLSRRIGLAREVFLLRCPGAGYIGVGVSDVSPGRGMGGGGGRGRGLYNGLRRTKPSSL